MTNVPHIYKLIEVNYLWHFIKRGLYDHGKILMEGALFIQNLAQKR